ncbi:MAG: response regulator [Lachnospiraceae bacterium]|nr:response regulator [Lachnospiraceae bacterium]
MDKEDKHNTTILIVDDLDVNIMLLEEILGSLGYNTRSAMSAKEATDILNEKLPQMVLLDIMMPDINGYEFCQMLKENPHTRDIPVIFVSAAESDDEREKAFEIGGVDFIRKPFDLTEIKTRVSTHLNIYNLRQELEENNRKLNQVISEQNEKILNEKKRILENLVKLSSDEDDMSMNKDNIVRNSRMLTQALNFTDKYENKISEAFIEGVEIAGSIRNINPKIFKIFFTDDETSPTLQAAADVIDYHNERWDGSGTPLCLSKEDIPLAARIVAITETFESYIKSGLSREDAFDKMNADRGVLFDPYLMDLFIKIKKQIKS